MYIPLWRAAHLIHPWMGWGFAMEGALRQTVGTTHSTQLFFFFNKKWIDIIWKPQNKFPLYKSVTCGKKLFLKPRNSNYYSMKIIKYKFCQSHPSSRNHLWCLKKNHLYSFPFQINHLGCIVNTADNLQNALCYRHRCLPNVPFLLYTFIRTIALLSTFCYFSTALTSLSDQHTFVWLPQCILVCSCQISVQIKSLHGFQPKLKQKM